MWQIYLSVVFLQRGFISFGINWGIIYKGVSIYVADISSYELVGWLQIWELVVFAPLMCWCFALAQNDNHTLTARPLPLSSSVTDGLMATLRFWEFDECVTEAVPQPPLELVTVDPRPEVASATTGDPQSNSAPMSD
jgi:hypothetical protein